MVTAVPAGKFVALPAKSATASAPFCRMFGAKNEIDARNAGVSEREVAARVRVEAVEIEGRVGQIVGAVVEDDDQAVERRVAGAAVVELDELRRVRRPECQSRAR